MDKEVAVYWWGKLEGIEEALEYVWQYDGNCELYWKLVAQKEDTEKVLASLREDATISES